MSSEFQIASILLVYIPKTVFFAWAAWQFWQRWKIVTPATELTPEEQVQQTLGRKFSFSAALLFGMVALDSLSWLAILYIYPILFPDETPVHLNYGSWVLTNAGEMIGLFVILRLMGIIRWSK